MSGLALGMVGATASQDHIAVGIGEEVIGLNPEGLEIALTLCLEFFDGEAVRVVDGFDFHEAAESLHPVDMELDVPDEVDLTLFVHDDPGAQHIFQNHLQWGPIGDRAQGHFRCLGACLVRALIADKGVLDVTPSQFESSRRNMEIDVTLMVRPSEISSPAEQE